MAVNTNSWSTLIDRGVPFRSPQGHRFGGIRYLAESRWHGRVHAV